MIISFTGTREGMTTAQQKAVVSLLRIRTPLRVRHGDCKGADAQFHALAHSLGLPVDIYPPDNPTVRAFCGLALSDTLLPEAPYLERNQTLVRGSDLLIGAPRDYAEEVRSGTWATIRYARRQSIQVALALPDGSLR